MYILEKHQITPSALGLLLFVKYQQSAEYNKHIVVSHMYDFTTSSGERIADVLEGMGLIHYIKGKKSQPEWEKVRLTELGERILKEMVQKPQHPLTEYMYNTIKNQYERIGAEKKYIVGGKKILHYISEFLYHKDTYTEKMIDAVIYTYAEEFSYDRKYLNKMDTLIYKPGNVYATKWVPEDCPLEKFIDSNIDKIKHNYKKLNG